MKKSPLIVTQASFSGSLGMLAINFVDQNEKPSTFHFLPSQFRSFSDAVQQVAEQVAPGDIQSVSPIPKISISQRQTAEVAAKWSQSQSAAFSVMVDPVENVAFLCLRSFSGDEAVTPLDADTINKLVHHLQEARRAINPAGNVNH